MLRKRQLMTSDIRVARMSSDLDFFDKRWQTFFSTCLNFPPTTKLKNKRDLTQIAKPNFAHSLKAANLFSRLKPMIKG